MYVTTASDVLNTAQPILKNLFAPEFPINERKLKSGEPLFHEGDEAVSVYQVMEGVIRTSKLLSNGRRQILCFGYPGDLVGLSHDNFYHNECEAVSDVKLRVLARNACSTNSISEPVICGELLKYASTEISHMQEHFMVLGCKSATEKIASFLVTLAERTGHLPGAEICINLPMKRADIADFLGVTIETVSRTMTKFRNAGIIYLPDPHRVFVANLSALKALAESED
jgi:CRP-like cAMP-binding protein